MATWTKDSAICSWINSFKTLMRRLSWQMTRSMKSLKF